MAEAHQAVAPSQAGGETGRARRKYGGRLLALGLVAFVAVLAVYVADLVTHLSTMTAMRDLIVYRDGGLITRQISPPYNGSKYAPLYSWTGSGGVSFTYAPIAAVIFAVGSVLPWLVLRWVMTVASLAALLLSAWLMFGKLGYDDRRVRTGATLLVVAAALGTEPVQQKIGRAHV